MEDLAVLHPRYEICGMDISQWQIWSNPVKTLEQGVEFVILRAGYGIRRDTRLSQHRATAERINLPMAFYWYWLPHYTAKEQARHLRMAIHGGDRVFIDLEKNTVDRWPENITPQQVTRQTLEFLEEVDRVTGDEAGIYTSAGWWNSWVLPGSIPKYRLSFRPLWVAQWFYSFQPRPHPLPRGWTKYDLWQFSGTTGPWARKASEFGITRSVSVDVDAFNGTQGELWRALKFHDYHPVGRPADAVAI
jgi:GH25 family lysozyme M1 (1,4-beta-N-acetylmuramidase)